MSDNNNNELHLVGNGRVKGRRVPPLPTFTFEDGTEVKIRRLGPFTMDEIGKRLRKERKPPEPPQVQVEIGEARVKTTELNYDAPSYKRALAEYQTWVNTSIGEAMINLMINYCIVCDVDEERVTDLRTMLALIDPAANESYSDKEVYIRFGLLSSDTELKRVQSFILNQSMPTQEAVQAHIDTFPAEVPGEGPVQTPGAPIRVDV